jgi:hypothetical protein
MRSQSNRPCRKEGASIICGQTIDHSKLTPSKPLSLTGNVALRGISAFANVSKSKMYKLGLVPMYDEYGELIENNTIPPFPWLRLPTPIVKTGKKLWNAEDVMRWHYLVRARALQVVLSDDWLKCEVSHDH